MGYPITIVLLMLLKNILAATPEENMPRSKCVMEDGRDGVCVPNYQCNIDNTVNEQAFIDLRFRSCPQVFEVCCLQTEFVAPTPPTPAAMPTCGWSNSGALGIREKPFLIGSAEYAEFPWMVAILKTTAPVGGWSQPDYLGGGSIIHPSVVITAAHKVDGFYENEVKCRAGEYDTSTEDEDFLPQERQVAKFITHDDFFRIQAYFDVALLVLKEPFTFQGQPHVGVACLGRRLPPPGTRCYATGWGKGSDLNYTSILKKIDLPLIDSDKCQHTLRNTRLGSRFLLHPSLICAGGVKGVDTCIGDGGSPLVCNIGDPKNGVRYAIFGIVSSGVGCGVRNVPGVYVNVPYIYSWVLEKMNEEKLESKYFSY
ncbi:phenoloxidase-activating factor 2-like [Battus philenor]|uniref:phenoloxidase-activating factor 2-like n=1 Tax=Battus philenor TaxID=42288 RepID=UPI0035D0A166